MNNDKGTFKHNDSQPASVRAKPTIKVRINPRPKASYDHDLILQALARLTARLTTFEGLLSEFLRHQESEKIRRREVRW